MGLGRRVRARVRAINGARVRVRVASTPAYGPVKV